VDRSIETRRAATRFEPDATTPVDPNAIAAAEATPTTAAPPAATSAKPVAETDAEEDYTSRLLKAKKEVWKDRPRDRPDSEE
jgi:hypothetical protein